MIHEWELEFEWELIFFLKAGEWEFSLQLVLNFRHEWEFEWELSWVLDQLLISDKFIHLRCIKVKINVLADIDYPFNLT